MREIVECKNTIGRTAAVLKKPYKATFNFFLNLGEIFCYSYSVFSFYDIDHP